MSEVRAVVIDGFGDAPHLAAFPLPELAPAEVLIEVQAASVNAFDWKAWAWCLVWQGTRELELELGVQG